MPSCRPCLYICMSIYMIIIFTEIIFFLNMPAEIEEISFSRQPLLYILSGRGERDFFGKPFTKAPRHVIIYNGESSLFIYMRAGSRNLIDFVSRYDLLNYTNEPKGDLNHETYENLCPQRRPAARSSRCAEAVRERQREEQNSLSVRLPRLRHD